MLEASSLQSITYYMYTIAIDIFNVLPYYPRLGMFGQFLV